jgi:hypothetical protein
LLWLENLGDCYINYCLLVSLTFFLKFSKNLNFSFILWWKWWPLFIVYCLQVLWRIPCKWRFQLGSFLPQLFATNHTWTLHLCWTGTWITATTVQPWNQVPWADQSTVFGLLWRSAYSYSYSLNLKLIQIFMHPIKFRSLALCIMNNFSFLCLIFPCAITFYYIWFS